MCIDYLLCARPCCNHFKGLDLLVFVITILIIPNFRGRNWGPPPNAVLPVNKNTAFGFCVYVI